MSTIRSPSAPSHLFQIVLAHHDQRGVVVARQGGKRGVGDRVDEAVEHVHRAVVGIRPVAAQRLEHVVLDREFIFVAVDLRGEFDLLLLQIVEDRRIVDIELLHKLCKNLCRLNQIIYIIIKAYLATMSV